MVCRLLLLCTALFTGCATPPVTPKNVAGIYHSRVWFPVGEDLVLRENSSFTHTWFSDNADDQNPTNFIETQGRYELRGNRIEFESTVSRARQPANETRLPPLKTTKVGNRIIDFRWGRFAIWFPDEYEDFVKTHRKPHYVLYSERRARPLFSQ